MKKMVSVFIIIMGLLSVARLYATIWYVHPDSTINSIQAGLNYCSADDTVLVAANIYHENIVWPNTPGIKLISESGPDATIIDGSLANASVIEILGVDSAIIQGFTVQEGGYTSTGGGFVIYNSSATLIGNIIQNNTANHGGGLYIDNSSVTLTENTIRNNQTTGGMGGGLKIMNNSVVVCTSNVIQNNFAGWAGGGFYIQSSSVSFTENLIEGNFADLGGGGACVWNSYITIIGNEILNNNCGGASTGGGFDINDSEVPLIDDNIIQGNHASVGGGLSLWHNSLQCTISNNLIKDNNSNAQGGGIRVHLMIGEGLLIVDNIIEGNTAGHGGGIHVDVAQPTISGNEIRNNSAISYGGGINIHNGGCPGGLAHVSLLNNIIENNHASAGGGLIWSTSAMSLVNTPHIIGNTIRNNSACVGAGIFFFHLDVASGQIVPANQFMDNIIQGNSASISGGGIAHLLHTPMAGTNNIIHNNSAVEYGGAIYTIPAAHQHSSLFILEKSLISANRSGYGGAVSHVREVSSIYPNEGSCYLDSCFVVDNGSIDNMNSGLAWIDLDPDTLKISHSHLYYNTFQPDVEIVNNTSIIIPIEHNFWWDTTALGIASLIQGPNDHEPAYRGHGSSLIYP